MKKKSTIAILLAALLLGGCSSPAPAPAPASASAANDTSVAQTTAATEATSAPDVTSAPDTTAATDAPAPAETTPAVEEPATVTNKECTFRFYEEDEPYTCIYTGEWKNGAPNGSGTAAYNSRSDLGGTRVFTGSFVNGVIADGSAVLCRFTIDVRQ